MSYLIKDNQLIATTSETLASGDEIRVPPSKFYESNGEAMGDIKRCAKLEQEQAK